MVDTGAGLGKRRGVRFELTVQTSLAGRRDIWRSADLLGKGGRNGQRRWFVLHSLLARFKQLVDPILNDVIAALNAQGPDVGHK